MTSTDIDDRGFSLGLTQADRQADWDRMTPEWRQLAREKFRSVVGTMELVGEQPEIIDQARGLLEFLDFGDFGDCVPRLEALVAS